MLHVSDGKSSERRIDGEDFATHGLGGNHVDHAGVSTLDRLGELTFDLTGSLVNTGDDFLELASNVGGVAVQHRAVSVLDLSGVIHDNHLGQEAGDFRGGVVLGVRGDVSSLDVLDRETLDVESDVVTGDGLFQLFVVHFHGLNIGLESNGGEGDVHVGLEDTGFHTADGDSTDTTDLINILQGETEGLVKGSLGGFD